MAHRSPLCPPPASRPGLVDKKKYSWVSSSNSFWNCYILSLVPPTWSSSWLEVLDSDCHLAPWWLFGLGPLSPVRAGSRTKKIRGFLLHSQGFPSMTWAWDCAFHQEQVTSTSRASTPPSCSMGLATPICEATPLPLCVSLLYTLHGHMIPSLLNGCCKPKTAVRTEG